jgi:hypothetical protein
MNNHNETIQSILTHLTEEAVTSRKIDLWPSIRSHLQTSKTYSMQKENKMNTYKNNQRRMRVPAIILAIFILVVVFFAATPLGNVWAQSVLQFFTRGPNDTMPGYTAETQTWVEQTPGQAAATPTPFPTQPGPAFAEKCGDLSNPTCAIEEIRGQVSFTIYQLGTIPEGLYFVGATGSPVQVHIKYRTSDQSGQLLIDEEPWSGSLDQKPWQVGASADIKTVEIDGITAEYVKGTYYTDGSSPAKWNPDADIEILRWVNKGVLFSMEKFGKQPPMDMDALTALIGSMTQKPVAGLPTLPTQTATEDPLLYIKEMYAQSVDQVQQTAGFKLALPTRLPETLTFLGARFDPDQKTAAAFYWFNVHSGITDGLSVSEQPTKGSNDCNLCGFVLGDGTDLDKQAPGKEVGKDAKIDTVQIGGVSGQYVEGTWSGTDKGWVWDADPYLKTLRWQANGTAYELSYMGMGIEKEDMLTIAQSIK